MKEDQHKHYRELVLFPGVEITTQNGVHLLAIFGPDKTQRDIDQLMGAVEYNGTPGKSDGVTNESLSDVVDIIKRLGGIAIPAHVDFPNGLFKKLQGNGLEPALKNDNLYTMEVIDDDYEPPQRYTEKGLQWSRVKGSDTHFKTNDRFGTFTWVKMDNPSIEGLKLALTDGDSSVNRNSNIDPNQHAEWTIEKLVVTQAKYLGRTQPIECKFSPFLNAFIGGRGTGKSSLLEFMRLTLQRENDIPNRLQEENKKFYESKGNNALLLPTSKLSLHCRKGTVKYRLNWQSATNTASIEELKNGAWTHSPGEIRSLFPAGIYSQKQIFELAGEPSALLDIIDEAPDVEWLAYNEEKRRLENNYKQTENMIQEIDEVLANENRLLGEQNDTARQIKQIEDSRHKEVLETFRTRQQQKDEIENLEDSWNYMAKQLEETRAIVAPPPISENTFQHHPEMLSALKSTNQKWKELEQKLENLSLESNTIITEWNTQKDAAEWMHTLTQDLTQYQEVINSLSKQNIDPNLYPELLNKHRNIENSLQQMDTHRTKKQELKIENEETFNQIKKNRQELTTRRQNFLTSVLSGNTSVSIKVEPFDEKWESIKTEIRNILHLNAEYKRDFECLELIYTNANPVEQGIEQLKEKIIRIRNKQEQPQDARLIDRLQQLTQDSINNLNLWFPQDDLTITFGNKNQPIEQGSPGQKTAALLAFILSYGSDPLLLDQPEDDLDNELIYELVVQQLKQIKTKRQVIVATHNANIVVNGDAEMVLPLKIKKGKTVVKNPASIQEKQVRESICNILEGGIQAFKMRYKRINI